MSVDAAVALAVVLAPHGFLFADGGVKDWTNRFGREWKTQRKRPWLIAWVGIAERTASGQIPV